MLETLVILTEVATAALFLGFCRAIASDGDRGPLLEIKVAYPVGRLPICNVQVAFLVAYSVYFASIIVVTLGLLQ